jgi:hypothetical protein
VVGRNLTHGTVTGGLASTYDFMADVVSSDYSFSGTSVITGRERRLDRRAGRWPAHADRLDNRDLRQERPIADTTSSTRT